MTLLEALELHAGDHVTHAMRAEFNHAGALARHPMRVTEVWINKSRTIVLVRLASIAKVDWLDATEYDVTPQGHVYDYTAHEWVSRAELKARKAQRVTAPLAVNLPR